MLIQAAIIKSDHLLFWSTRHSPAPSGSSLSPPSPFPGPHSQEHVDWASAGSENWSRSWLKLLRSRSGLNSCLSPSVQPQDKQLLLFNGKVGKKWWENGAWENKDHHIWKQFLGWLWGNKTSPRLWGNCTSAFVWATPSRANTFQSRSSCSQFNFF